MLRDHPTPTPPDESAGVVLTCTNPDCGHTFEPHPTALVAALACPECEAGTFQARLAASARAAAGGAR